MGNSRTAEVKTLSPQSAVSKQTGEMADQSRDPLDRAAAVLIGGVRAGGYPPRVNRAVAQRSLLHLQRQRGDQYVQRLIGLATKAEGTPEVTPEVESAHRARGGGNALNEKVRDGSVQRAPAATTAPKEKSHLPHGGAARAESPEDYVDLMTGIEHVLQEVTKDWFDMTDGVVSLDVQEVKNPRQRKALGALQFGGHLTPNHHDLLESLRTAFVLARAFPTFAAPALKLWESLQKDLGIAFQRAPAYVENDLTDLQKRLTDVGEKLIRGGAYTAAHSKAEEQVDLKVPDLVFQEEKFAEAAEELETVKELAKKAGELTSETVLDQALEKAGVEGEMGKAILELVKSPHEIHKGLEEFKKKGVIKNAVTVADLADKVLGIRNAIVKVSCTVIQRFAAGMVEKAAADTAKHWAHIAEWAGEKLEVLEKVEKVAGVITIAVSAIKIVDAIREGKWGKAITEAATTGAGYLAGVAVKGGGSAGLAMVAGSVVVVAAEIQGIHDAAAFLRYCDNANVREAAMTFVDECVSAANIGAKGFIADVAMLGDPGTADQKSLILASINSYVKYWQRALQNMSKQVSDTRVVRIGGQPAMRDALGGVALQVLLFTANAPATYQQMAQQIFIVFEAANKMAEYVVKNYPRSEKTEGGEE